ncbi:FMN-binding protein MioC [Alteromonas facilis]|uniref:FMN-binding protein MioC n=1 Tax=Alteromonas facilis TaxID=2048004 RepID=UPI000C28EF67|nr:FMN-binding protein MioC [Alteromonas facilis]
MKKIQIIVGSVLGASEYVADALSEKLQSEGFATTVHLEPSFNDIDPEDCWLICTSTHGAGDLPDNIQAFAEALESATLPELPYMVISLGDSSYDTFCNGGSTIHRLMKETQAKPLSEPFEIDVLQHPIPEDIALEWLESHINLFK